MTPSIAPFVEPLNLKISFRYCGDKNESGCKKTLKSGHGGMDGIMMYRIVECLNNGLPLDQNVYEGCFWSAVAPLSKQSILDDGKPQEFPDFTRGKWKETEKLGIVI